MQAEKIFKEVRALDPYHLKGLEYYSTLLWHSHKVFENPSETLARILPTSRAESHLFAFHIFRLQPVELSFLAHQLEEDNPKEPESWIMVGNCFSLQKEHDTAIKCFNRAIQIDPHFAYAYTVCPLV